MVDKQTQDHTAGERLDNFIDGVNEKATAAGDAINEKLDNGKN